MSTIFADVPAWPGKGSGEQLSSGRDARLDNAPPLDERIVQEFLEDIDREGITARIAELVDSASRAPKCEDQTIAGRIGDLCKLAGDVSKRLDAAREKHNRPLLTAQRNLKARADGLIAPLSSAIAKLRDDLNRFTREEAARRAEEARKAEEEAKRAREELERANVAPEIIETIQAPKVEARPIARGDYGSRVGTRTVWHHEIEVPIAKLPKLILEAAPVREAVEKVISAAIRGGNRNIKGVRIWSEQEAAVR